MPNLDNRARRVVRRDAWKVSLRRDVPAEIQQNCTHD
jgi:hypothetical protein